MTVELKTICDQLTDAIELPFGLKVAAHIEGEILKGWCIVRLHPDGQISPIDSKVYDTIKDLMTLKEVYHKLMIEAIKQADKQANQMEL